MTAPPETEVFARVCDKVIIYVYSSNGGGGRIGGGVATVIIKVIVCFWVFRVDIAFGGVPNRRGRRMYSFSDDETIIGRVQEVVRSSGGTRAYRPFGIDRRVRTSPYRNTRVLLIRSPDHKPLRIV